MRRFIVAFIVGVMLLSVLAGCTETLTVYICANGKEVPDKALCATNKVAGVKKVEAESYARNYVSAFFSPYGGKAQLVSSYLDPDKGDYFATFIVAEKDSAPYQTVVLVDGVTGKVNCTEKCDYVQ
jgi:hypothetical protein